MLKNLSKLFNISCLLGLHENIVVVSTTVAKAEDDLRKSLHEIHKWDCRVVNTLPIPKNVNEELVVTSCPHCGYIRNDLHRYIIKRTKYYMRIVDRYTKAVENYLTYYNNVHKAVE